MGLKPSNMYKASTGFCWGLNYTTGRHMVSKTTGILPYSHPFHQWMHHVFLQLSHQHQSKWVKVEQENPRVAMAKTQVRRQHVICKCVWQPDIWGFNHFDREHLWKACLKVGGVPGYPMCLKSWLPGLPFGSSGGTNCPTQFLGFQFFYGGVLQFQGHDHLLGTSRNIDKVGTASAMFVGSCWPQETILQ